MIKKVITKVKNNINGNNIYNNKIFFINNQNKFFILINNKYYEQFSTIKKAN